MWGPVTTAVGLTAAGGDQLWTTVASAPLLGPSTGVKILTAVGLLPWAPAAVVDKAAVAQEVSAPEAMVMSWGTVPVAVAAQCAAAARLEAVPWL